MDDDDTGVQTNSSWFASAIDANLDSETESDQGSSQDENDSVEEDE